MPGVVSLTTHVRARLAASDAAERLAFHVHQGDQAIGRLDATPYYDVPPLARRAIRTRAAVAVQLGDPVRVAEVTREVVDDLAQDYPAIAAFGGVALVRRVLDRLVHHLSNGGAL